MARKVITVLTDDLEGGDADRTVEFGLDGVSYTIDLSEKNAGKLRKALDPYLAAGTRIGRGGLDSRRAGRRSGAAAPTRTNRDQNKAIREWAIKSGYEVSERGRIPASVVKAYNER
ncbi:histone-like nucleoid-structuring protein Lsr2 [Micromonospora sp. NPDC003197]